MICNIIGCGHKILRPNRNQISKSWSLYGICICCFFECIQMKIFTMPVWYVFSSKCLRSLKAEGYDTFVY